MRHGTAAKRDARNTSLGEPVLQHPPLGASKVVLHVSLRGIVVGGHRSLYMAVAARYLSAVAPQCQCHAGHAMAQAHWGGNMSGGNNPRLPRPLPGSRRRARTRLGVALHGGSGCQGHFLLLLRGQARRLHGLFRGMAAPCENGLSRQAMRQLLRPAAGDPGEKAELQHRHATNGRETSSPSRTNRAKYSVFLNGRRSGGPPAALRPPCRSCRCSQATYTPRRRSDRQASELPRTSAAERRKTNAPPWPPSKHKTCDSHASSIERWAPGPGPTASATVANASKRASIAQPKTLPRGLELAAERPREKNISGTRDLQCRPRYLDIPKKQASRPNR